MNRLANEEERLIELFTPLSIADIKSLDIGDIVSISGEVIAGRDTALPKLCDMINDNSINSLDISLKDSVVFHTAISPAGVGPTSSNKKEIEDSFEPLAKAGVSFFLGKGAISKETVCVLAENNACFAVIPPVTALLSDRTIKREVIAFPELGMEALNKLLVSGYPAIIAAINGKSIFSIDEQ